MGAAGAGQQSNSLSGAGAGSDGVVQVFEASESGGSGIATGNNSPRGLKQ